MNYSRCSMVQRQRVETFRRGWGDRRPQWFPHAEEAGVLWGDSPVRLHLQVHVDKYILHKKNKVVYSLHIYKQ